ncbi:hemicentin-1 [Silurus meridionalis]|nr:hemicentin-1 [Silurus meridionalis]
MELRVYVAPSIRPGNFNVTLLKGRRAVLSCEAFGVPPPQVNWKRNGHTLNTDSGTYRYFTFVVPPSIEDDVITLTAIKMESVVLPCHVTGRPTPSISWSRGGTVLGTGKGSYKILPTGMLEIGSVNPTHAGRYTCSAQNTAGVTQKHIILSVHGQSLKVLSGGTLRLSKVTLGDAGTYSCLAQNAAVPPVISVPHNEYTLSVGESVSVPCSAIGQPEPELQWHKLDGGVRGGAKQFTFTNGTLQIKKAQLEHAGVYTCTASNSAGRTSHDITLTLHVAPMIHGGQSEVSVIQGFQSLLPCLAQGVPNPTIHWKKNGKFIQNLQGRFTVLRSGELIIERTQLTDAGFSVDETGRSLLMIENVSVRDSGSYVCSAENSVGSIRTLAFIRITEPPVLTGVGRISVFVSHGAVVVLDCPVRGTPAPVLRWFKDGRLLQSMDSGDYQCVAENEVGVIERMISLKVQGDSLRRARASVIGMVNDHEFGISFLKMNITENSESRSSTLKAYMEDIPPSVGPLLKVLISALSPIYWTAVYESAGMKNGFSISHGFFRQESQLEFHTGEILKITHVARGLDEEGVLLVDVVINGFIPSVFLSPVIHQQQIHLSDISSSYNMLNFRLDFHITATLSLPDADECVSDSPCSHSCINIMGGFSCSCPSGFTINIESNSCQDIDECVDGSHMCLHNQLCMNTVGNYRCEVNCGPGFRHRTADVDECVESSVSPCQHQCFNTLGSFRCSCLPGYQLVGHRCFDINECMSSVCPSHQQCKNTEGGYECFDSCPPGMTQSESSVCVGK